MTLNSLFCADVPLNYSLSAASPQCEPYLFQTVTFRSLTSLCQLHLF